MTNYNSCNMMKLYNISFNVIWLSFKKRWDGGYRKLMVSWLRLHLNVNQFIDELMKEWEFIECHINENIFLHPTQFHLSHQYCHHHQAHLPPTHPHHYCCHPLQPLFKLI